MSSVAQAQPRRELVLARYRPLRPLGRGGSGSVWLAHDERTGLEVALKIVPREGKRASRAAREAEAASRLRHERCVRAYDFGEDDGHVYIAYEYVHGRTLRQALREGALSVDDAVEACAQILDGLAHAHARGIIHRDVKPSNVLLEDGDEVSVKLLDFGLAQLDEFDTLTAVGDVPGTLAYISPERLHGGEATPSSDVWAVGIILWEALAERHPFWGVPLPQVAAAIDAGPPPLLHERPELPRRLVADVERAVSLDPRRRPSAAQLADELRRLPAAESRTAPAVEAQPRPHLRLDVSHRRAVQRFVPAAAAALTTAMGATLLPFWPPLLVAGLTISAALLALRLPRAGLAVALFAPLFPIGNESAAAALVYAALALSLLALGWRDARAGLAFVAGPILAPLGLIALLPLAVQPARGPLRRFAHAAVGVWAAALVAGLHGRALPVVGAPAPDLEIAADTSPGEAASALGAFLAESPALLTGALAFGASAAAVPYALRAGRWGIAALGAGQIALVLLTAPSIPALSIVVGTWLLCGALALGSR